MSGSVISSSPPSDCFLQASPADLHQDCLHSGQSDIPIDSIENPSLSHYLISKLANRPVVRTAVLRSTWTLPLVKGLADELSAYYVQLSGALAATPCTACAVGLEVVFEECAVVSEYMGGSCASCLYSGIGGRVCSLSTTGMSHVKYSAS